MWIVEFVKNVITGHIRTPIRNANDGQRYARHARRRQTSSPTIASANRKSDSSRKPVANIQWTCSAGGCITTPRDRGATCAQRACGTRPRDDDKERRLDDEEPESLAVRVQ